MKKTIKNLPTNIITGFLGVGKTTAILHLLKNKPDNENWAILVNEFGEIGIDESLFLSSKSNDQGVFIKEVPGGCMCCTAGLPMQIALAQLLSEAQPDRLLIEPTGLGHPTEVLSTLKAEHYEGVLDIQKIVTLVDARKVSEEKYAEHPTFRQQIEIADIIVANKADQYHAEDLPKLKDYLNTIDSRNSKPIYVVSMGEIEQIWLNGKTKKINSTHDHHSHPLDRLPDPSLIQNDELPECGYLSIENEGEGFFSQGWIFKPDFIFSRHDLDVFFLSASVERLKGTFITDQGHFSYNKADGVLTETSINDIKQSRIELIANTRNEFDNFESTLLQSILN